jgi:hypothetical protein
MNNNYCYPFLGSHTLKKGENTKKIIYIRKKRKKNNSSDKRIPKRSENDQKLVEEVKNTKIKI